jgi:hypothetical protein
MGIIGLSSMTIIKMTTFMKDTMTNDIATNMKDTTNDIFALVIGVP